jgi:phasin
MNNPPNRTTATKSPGNGGQVLREAVETGSAQTKQVFEKMSAATTDATNLVRDSYSTAFRRAQDCNAKFVEFAQTNTEAALNFAQQLSSVKSPTEFFEVSANHSRKQLETLTEQAKELTALAQKALLTTAERVEANIHKAHNQSS